MCCVTAGPSSHSGANLTRQGTDLRQPCISVSIARQQMLQASSRLYLKTKQIRGAMPKNTVLKSQELNPGDVKSLIFLLEVSIRLCTRRMSPPPAVCVRNRSKGTCRGVPKSPASPRALIKLVRCLALYLINRRAPKLV